MKSPANSPIPRASLGGLPCDLVDESTLHGLLEAAARASTAPVFIASANLDKIHYFGRGSALEGFFDRSLHRDSWLILLDGAPLVRRARVITGTPWPRLAGSDLLPWLLETAAATGTRVGFLGGDAAGHTLLRQVLHDRWPTLEVAGTWAPSREQVADPDESRKVADSVRAADTHLLIVALTPNGERWLDTWGDACGIRVGAALGAAADFLIGTRRRAPETIQRLGLEWAWRLAHEPRRLARRYLVEGPACYVKLQRHSAFPG